MFKVSKFYKNIGLIFLAIVVFSVSFAFVPTFTTFASNNDDYEKFNRSLMSILRENDDLTNVDVIDLSSDDYVVKNEEVLIKEQAVAELGLQSHVATSEGFYTTNQLSSENILLKSNNEGFYLEKQPQANRLIVNSNFTINSFGAIAKAEYQDLHIYQYQSLDQAEKAFDYFSNLDKVNSVSFDQVVSVNGEIETHAQKTYNSWGAEYIGYSDYTQTMLEMFSQDQLPTIVVPVLDSGIFAEHTMFNGRVDKEHAKNFATELAATSYEYQDLNGHGTHVSGTIVEATLSNVKILPLKVLNKNGKGWESSIVNAIKYVENLKKDGVNIKVMNMSIGIDDKSSVGEVSTRSMALTNAIISAYNQGVLSVVSAGNESRNTSLAVPANVDCAITVSGLALRYSLNGNVLAFDASYSNFGEHVDLCAPGTSILSAGLSSNSSLVRLSGTSMAAPHVTACAALIFSNPNYTTFSPAAVTKLLKNNAVDLGDQGKDDYYGYGLVNIKNIGSEYIGNIVFSSTDPFPQSAINVTLSYDEAVSSGNSLKIYYTTDEYAKSIDIETAQVYNNPITISKTTKITAMAYVYNSSGGLLRKSNLGSFTYYFDNIDLLSNYEFEPYSNGYMISKYSGILSTLQAPNTYNDIKIVGVGSFAFNDSKVENLYLPNTVETFANNAFNGSSSLKQIHCENESIKIGNSAFRRCTNLTNLDLNKIVTLGSYSFANCIKMESLYLPYITTIGFQAFSASSIKTLFIGNHIQSIGEQNDLSLSSVFGYSDTVAQTFAEKNNVEFINLGLRITQNLSANKIIKENQQLNLEFGYFGFEVEHTVNFTGDKAKINEHLKDINEYEKKLTISLSGLEIGKYELNVNLKDKYLNSLSSHVLTIQVVSSATETFGVNFEEGNFSVFVNGDLITPSTLLFKNLDYSFKISPEDGFILKKIIVNGQERAVNAEISLKSVSEDVNIVVQAVPKSSLNVVFETYNRGVIVVEDSVVANASVERNGSLTFSVTPNLGFVVKKVLNGEEVMFADNYGYYHIENIVSDKSISVVFEEKFYDIKVSLGKGGNISSSGGQVGTASHGSSRTYIISTNEGYKIDFVSVNGNIVELKNNSFKLSNIDSDCDIVVSFTKTGSLGMFDSGNSIIFVYFMIFLSLFVVFLISKLVLSIMRRIKIR